MTEPETRAYTLEESRIIRARQAVRSRILAAVLVAMCVLFFAVTIVKISTQ
jgi:hypothetical protein